MGSLGADCYWTTVENLVNRDGISSGVKDGFLSQGQRYFSVKKRPSGSLSVSWACTVTDLWDTLLGLIAFNLSLPFLFIVSWPQRAQRASLVSSTYKSVSFTS